MSQIVAMKSIFSTGFTESWTVALVNYIIDLFDAESEDTMLKEEMNWT